MRKIIDFYKKNKNYFDLMEKHHSRDYYSSIFSALKKLKINLKEKEILDVGCGTGKFLRLLRREFRGDFNAIGIDISNLGKKFATGIKFIQGDAHRLPFRDSSFDIVFSIDTLEHLLSPYKAIEEMYRVTKNNGFIIIRTRNYRSPLTTVNIRYFFGFLFAYFLRIKEDLRKIERLSPFLDNNHLGGDYDAVSAIFAERLKETFLRKNGKIHLFLTWAKKELNFLNYLPILKFLGSMSFIVFNKTS